MKNNTLTTGQLACITWLFLLGGFTASEAYNSAGRDAWISLIAAAIAAIPMVLVYARVSSLFGERDLFDILLAVFGKWFGRLLTLCVTLYAVAVGTLTLHGFPMFVKATSLPRTPLIVFALILGAVCAYLAWQGTPSFGKAGILFAVIAGFVIISTFLLLIPTMELDNLRPVLAAPLEDVGQNAAMLFFSPFGESVVLLCLFCGLKSGHSKYKAFFAGLILGGVFMAACVLRDILSLGAGNFSSLPFPSHNAMSTINIGTYFQRAEVLTESGMLLCDMIKIAVAIYAACLGASKLFNISGYRKAVPVVAAIMITLSVIFGAQTLELTRQFPGSLAFRLPVQILIPLILWIWGEVRIRGGGVFRP